MSKLDALTNFEVFIKFMRKEGFLMKKMLAKAVVLGLVLGGIGFVANDAQAADIGKGVKVHADKWTGIVVAEKGLITDLATQADLAKVNKVAEDAKAASAKNAGDIKTNADNIKTNADNIKTNADNIKTNADNIKTNADNIKTNADNIKTNADNIKTNSKQLIKEVADRKAEVSRLDGRIDKLNDNVQKVGAMAAAIANLHTMGYDPEAPTEIAVGVGQYRDKTGMALGAFHYPNRDFMLSFSVSTAGDEYMGGIGATWKFGRKTPEELRQAEAEKAAKAKLAKAEAAKKAAKDARVAAQQKRHAEMLAARTAK